MQIVSLGDNLHEMSKPNFIINMSSAEFVQRVIKVKQQTRPVARQENSPELVPVHHMKTYIICNRFNNF